MSRSVGRPLTSTNPPDQQKPASTAPPHEDRPSPTGPGAPPLVTRPGPPRYFSRTGKER
ncbi:hypothetical protein AB0I91_02075 [Actinosynnema sp. NPDC049800]